MTESWTIDVFLSLSVAAAWAAGLGFLWKRGAVESLHYPSFIAAASGSTLVLAGLFAEGLTPRVGKLMLLDGLALVAGLVMSHALARSVSRQKASLVRVPIRHPK